MDRTARRDMPNSSPGDPEGDLRGSTSDRPSFSGMDPAGSATEVASSGSHPTNQDPPMTDSSRATRMDEMDRFMEIESNEPAQSVLMGNSVVPDVGADPPHPPALTSTGVLEALIDGVTEEGERVTMPGESASAGIFGGGIRGWSPQSQSIPYTDQPTSSALSSSVPPAPFAYSLAQNLISNNNIDTPRMTARMPIHLLMPHPSPRTNSPTISGPGPVQGPPSGPGTFRFNFDLRPFGNGEGFGSVSVSGSSNIDEPSGVMNEGGTMPAGTPGLASRTNTFTMPPYSRSHVPSLFATPQTPQVPFLYATPPMPDLYPPTNTLSPQDPQAEAMQEDGRLAGPSRERLEAVPFLLGNAALTTSPLMMEHGMGSTASQNTSGGFGAPMFGSIQGEGSQPMARQDAPRAGPIESPNDGGAVSGRGPSSTNRNGQMGQHPYLETFLVNRENSSSGSAGPAGPNERPASFFGFPSSFTVQGGGQGTDTATQPRTPHPFAVNWDQSAERANTSTAHSGLAPGSDGSTMIFQFRPSGLGTQARGAAEADMIGGRAGGVVEMARGPHDSQARSAMGGDAVANAAQGSTAVPGRLPTINGPMGNAISTAIPRRGADAAMEGNPALLRAGGNATLLTDSPRLTSTSAAPPAAQAAVTAHTGMPLGTTHNILMPPPGGPPMFVAFRGMGGPAPPADQNGQIPELLSNEMQQDMRDMLTFMRGNRDMPDPARAKELLSGLKDPGSSSMLRLDRVVRAENAGGKMVSASSEFDGWRCAVCMEGGFSSQPEDQEHAGHAGGSAVGMQRSGSNESADSADSEWVADDVDMRDVERMIDIGLDNAAGGNPSRKGLPGRAHPSSRDLNKTNAKVFPCNHVFHEECLEPWLQAKTTCPTCRFDIDPLSTTLRQSQLPHMFRPTSVTRNGRERPMPYRRQAPAVPPAPGSVAPTATGYPREVTAALQLAGPPRTAPQQAPAFPGRAGPAIRVVHIPFQPGTGVAGAMAQIFQHMGIVRPGDPLLPAGNAASPGPASANQPLPSTASARPAEQAGVDESESVVGVAQGPGPGPAVDMSVNLTEFFIPFNLGNANQGPTGHGDTGDGSLATPAVSGEATASSELDTAGPSHTQPATAQSTSAQAPSVLQTNLFGRQVPSAPITRPAGAAQQFLPFPFLQGNNAGSSTIAAPPVRQPWRCPKGTQSLDDWIISREEAMLWRCSDQMCCFAPPKAVNSDGTGAFADEELGWSPSAQPTVQVYWSPPTDDDDVMEPQFESLCSHRFHPTCLQDSCQSMGWWSQEDGSDTVVLRCPRCRKQGFAEIARFRGDSIAHTGMDIT